MKKMFDWIITVGTTVLNTKREILTKLNKTHNIDIPLERYAVNLSSITTLRRIAFVNCNILIPKVSST